MNGPSKRMSDSITKVLEGVYKDALAGKNVGKYSIVLINKRAVLCRNCIEEFFCRIFRDRKMDLNDEMNKYFESKQSTIENENGDLPTVILPSIETGSKYSKQLQHESIEKLVEFINKYFKIYPNDQGSIESLFQGKLPHNRGELNSDAQEFLIIKEKPEISGGPKPFVQNNGEDINSEILKINDLLKDIEKFKYINHSFVEKLSGFLVTADTLKNIQFNSKLKELIDFYKLALGEDDIATKLKKPIEDFEKSCGIV